MNGLSLVLMVKEQYIAAEEIARRTLLRAENSEENKLEDMYKLGRFSVGASTATRDI